MGRIAEQSNRGEVIIYQSADGLAQRIREYRVNGFAIDDERLKGNADGNGDKLSPDEYADGNREKEKDIGCQYGAVAAYHSVHSIAQGRTSQAVVS